MAPGLLGSPSMSATNIRNRNLRRSRQSQSPARRIRDSWLRVVSGFKRQRSAVLRLTLRPRCVGLDRITITNHESRITNHESRRMWSRIGTRTGGCRVSQRTLTPLHVALHGYRHVEIVNEAWTSFAVQARLSGPLVSSRCTSTQQASSGRGCSRQRVPSVPYYPVWLLAVVSGQVKVDQLARPLHLRRHSIAFKPRSCRRFGVTA